MPFCPYCGKEITEGTLFCPNCGTKLAESEARAITEVKRPLSITACAILLFICAVPHIIKMVDLINYGDFASSISQLFLSIFALVAGYFLWKSKKIGGIIGIAYAIITAVASIALFAYFSQRYTIYDFIYDLSLSIAIIILIVIGWKHLKYPLPQKIAAVEQKFCLKCGAELRKEETFCSSCGTRIGEMCPENATEVKYPHQLATVLGYVFGFLGGWIGLVFGIYLRTREHPRAKYHGKIVLIITVVMLIFWIFVWLA